ncbi:MAG TPA: hypothetical protein DCW29_08830 [Janthinobacterium sp.]|nr:hypothetical protein [Janthinobacterium sp.]
MNKQEYLDALRRALTGLAPDTVAKTLAYYEQRYIDALAGGRAEAEIARDIGDPKKIAATLRANTHLRAFEQQRSPVNLLRMLVSAIGLGIFNLFMVVPALVYAALLAALYATALTVYVGGIAITASGLSGANELLLDGPLLHFILDDDGDGRKAPTRTRVSIGESAIHISQEPAPIRPRAGDEDRDDGNDDTPVPAQAASAKLMRRAVALAGSGVHIDTDAAHGSRGTQCVLGLGLVLFGIVLFLLSLVVTKFTLIGIKRYIEMNFSLLRGHQA